MIKNYVSIKKTFENDSNDMTDVSKILQHHELTNISKMSFCGDVSFCNDLTEFEK